MIRRKRYQFKKPLHNATHAGQCDAVMGRPNTIVHRQVYRVSQVKFPKPRRKVRYKEGSE